MSHSFYCSLPMAFFSCPPPQQSGGTRHSVPAFFARMLKRTLLHPQVWLVWGCVQVCIRAMVQCLQWSVTVMSQPLCIAPLPTHAGRSCPLPAQVSPRLDGSGLEAVILVLQPPLFLVVVAHFVFGCVLGCIRVHVFVFSGGTKVADNRDMGPSRGTVNVLFALHDQCIDSIWGLSKCSGLAEACDSDRSASIALIPPHTAAKVCNKGKHLQN